MSTTPSSDLSAAVSSCRPENVTPVRIDATDLDSTASEHLRDLKTELADAGYQPAVVGVEAHFDEDCSLATQSEADRLRGYVRAAAFLGAGRLAVTVESAADREKVDPALDALAERARRDGVTLDVIHAG
jgi:hypothetical protein